MALRRSTLHHRFRTGIWCPTVFLCIGLACLVHRTQSSKGGQVYTNQFAVEIHGGEAAAAEVARRHGFIYQGQIGTLENHYLFEHHSIHKRSTEASHSHHTKLEQDEQVRWCEQQVVKRRVKRDFNLDDVRYQEQFHRSYRIFSDPLYQKQWYLNGGALGGHDMNVAPAWERGYTGKGVVVTILDDGIQTNHPDLLQNYDAFASTDINDNDDDPMPQDNNDNKHGTRCAGEVAATALNEYCGVGVAYNASIGGVRMLDGTVTDEVEARALSLNPHHIDIYSASWGPEDDGKTVDGPGKLAKQAFFQGIAKGRHGLGSIFVWASGNGGRFNDNCNCDGYTNSIYTLSISSATQHGSKPWYLEMCSSTLATTYSSGSPGKDANVVTVDMDLSFRHKRNSDSLCTQAHTGTSASAPLAAGICALALEANPKLTWRDMQHLVVMTSRPEPLLGEEGWATTGVGRKVSHKFGYGLMDADAMVVLAEQWTTAPPQHVCRTNSDTTEWVIPNRPGESLEVTMNTSGCWGQRDSVRYIEHVQVVVSLQFLPRGSLRITLVSPSGTASHVLLPRSYDVKEDAFNNWPFMSVHFWGEPAAGTWRLILGSEGIRRSPFPGKLKEWYLIFYGTDSDPVKLRPRPHNSYIVRDTSASSAHAAVKNRPSRNPCAADAKYQSAESGECVDSCPAGQFGSRGSLACEACHPDCESCYGPSEDNCLACRAGRYLVDNACWRECPEGSYADPVLRQCVECDRSCSRCSDNSSFCSACKENYFLHGHSCLGSCPNGTRSMPDSRVCRSCHASCHTCTGESSHDCVTCSEGHWLYESQCFTHCPPKYYQGQDGFCRSCKAPCKECSSLKSCKSCVQYYRLDGSSCEVAYTPCGDGLYSPGGNCNRCHETCATCFGSNEDQCISCPPNKVWSNGRCVSECLLGFYSDAERTCVQCRGNCRKCTGEELGACTACMHDLILHNGQCIHECPVGFHPGGSGDNRRCLPCHGTCATCINVSATGCLSCPSGRALHGSTCVQFCPGGTFLRFSGALGAQCIQCHPACSSCTGPGIGSCTACSKKALLFQNTCVPCLADEFLSPSKKRCQKCSHPCRSCTGPGEDRCLSCVDGLSLDPLTWRCLPCCPSDATRATPGTCCVCNRETNECVTGTEHQRSTSWLVHDSATGTYDLSVQRVAMTVVGICAGAVAMFFLLFGLLEWSSSTGGGSILGKKVRLADWLRGNGNNGYSRLPGAKRTASDRARFEVEAEKVALTREDEEEDEEDEEIFHKVT
ncbi:furin [Ixodes scapularis]|uniref:furin n=1 Tax=Ixodes scapularis TaxID=6945 RepID=UPI001A9D188D|nr:furin [Ixodes scapularis]